MKEKYQLLALFGIALISRLIAWPHSQVVEADATSRLMLAEWANNHGGELSSLQWPAIHIYLLSFAQWILGDRVTGPVLLTLLLGAAAVIPFYLFTRNIFNREGAFYAALLFTFSPLIFRNSFTPLSEIYYVFFSLITIWTLSEGMKRGDKKLRWALFAGIASTLSCGTRFEPWILCGLLGLLLLLQREWKMFFVFVSVSAIFPVIWMIFCYVKTGDPFVSLEMVRHQNLDIGKINEHLDGDAIIYRILFFPFSWLVAVFPLVALVIFGMFPRIIRQRKEAPLRLLFSGIFIFFIVFFTVESLKGLLADQHRYTVSLIMFSLPLFSLWFEKGIGKWKWKAIFSVMIAVLLIPFSFSWYRVPFNKMALGNSKCSRVISRMIANTYHELFALPQVQYPVLVDIGRKIKNELKPEEGLFVDFWEWNASYYILQQSPENSHSYCGYDAFPHNGDQGRMVTFFSQYTTGMIMLSDYSTLSKEIKIHGTLLEFDSMPGGLMLKPLFNDGHFRLFKYTYLSAEETAVREKEYEFKTPLYEQKKDIEYYKYCISNNTEWMADLLRNINMNPIGLDEALTIEAAHAKKSDEEKGNK
jgi:Ca2+/Na+ antiporter